MTGTRLPARLSNLVPAPLNHIGHLAKRNNSTRAVLLSLLVLLIGACTPIPTVPYRNGKVDLTEHVCNPMADGTVPNTCKSDAPLERADNYDLLFSEFDDQGWLSEDAAKATIGLSKPESGQRQDTCTLDGASETNGIARIKNFLVHQIPPDQKLLVVVYVHGWKHTAAPDDQNVQVFRQQLNSLGEKEAPGGTRVVGIYVGWRGVPYASADVLEDLTFWNRKAAAEKIARGSINELFGYLEALERIRNGPLSEGPAMADAKGLLSDCEVTNGGREGASVDRHNASAQLGTMRTIYVGHSFGGLIVYEAVENGLLARIASGELSIEQGMKDTIPRAPDLVVLLNPAVEAARFQPVYRLMTARTYTHVQAPLMAIVTSDADSATRYAFPLGEEFTHEDWKSEQQRQATLQTIGHDKDFVTHRYVVKESPEGGSCDADWSSGKWPRCVGTKWELKRYCIARKPLPVWNITTVKAIIPDHNDVYEPGPLALISQLMFDVREHPTILKSSPVDDVDEGGMCVPDAPPTQ
ncbi:esterase/lipase/thioesterase family lipase [Burkholderia pseudomallei]|nr:esterase/lipase/thioesterase family lipase [Burkholderia pseudomallei]VBN63950.1 esterase/lipase/thioesterase family lipase [Burkholderia pseudomallei]